MHFLYIDESGNTGADLHCAQQPFVMAGLLVSDEKWRKTQSAVQTTLSAFLGGTLPENFELHACELLSPNGDGPFAGRPRAARNTLALDLLNLIVEAAASLAHFVEADRVTVARVTPGRLRGPLVRAMRGADPATPDAKGSPAKQPAAAPATPA